MRKLVDDCPPGFLKAAQATDNASIWTLLKIWMLGSRVEYESSGVIGKVYKDKLYMVSHHLHPSYRSQK